ncbi:hypothetical protein [Pseudomonas monteilii]|uniref:hypothetical protein n=1 Tax=Pseudomonas monteilii TaxID=76759 RepID=UPI00037A9D2D|nr:hypothetical protein [Pseudomonas monteilii]
MTPDWNWFFSSLSQSAAAIVGIFGAFIITKIFSNQSAFTEKNTKIKQSIIDAKKISEQAKNFRIAWYNKYYNHSEFVKFHTYLDENFSGNEDPALITDEIISTFYSSNQFSAYSGIDEVKAELNHIAKKICEQNAAENKRRAEIRKADIRAAREAKNFMFPGIPHYDMSGFNSMMEGPKPLVHSYEFIRMPDWKDLHAVDEGFEKIYIEAKHHTRTIRELLNATQGNPESPIQITAALILVLFIFFIGVIYPLSFMPAGGAPELSFTISTIAYNLLSFKGALLSLIATAFSIIVTMFYRTHAKMKYSDDDIRELLQLSDINNYSNYFKYLKH